VTVAERIALALANLRLRDTLRSQSILDPLTGLFNAATWKRRSTSSSPSRARPARDRHHHAGHRSLQTAQRLLRHDAGDALLRELGGLLMARVREGDIACRYGGEEFVLILRRRPWSSPGAGPRSSGRRCDNSTCPTVAGSSGRSPFPPASPPSPSTARLPRPSFTRRTPPLPGEKRGRDGSGSQSRRASHPRSAAIPCSGRRHPRHEPDPGQARGGKSFGCAPAQAVGMMRNARTTCHSCSASGRARPHGRRRPAQRTGDPD